MKSSLKLKWTKKHEKLQHITPAERCTGELYYATEREPKQDSSCVRKTPVLWYDPGVARVLEDRGIYNKGELFPVYMFKIMYVPDKGSFNARIPGKTYSRGLM